MSNNMSHTEDNNEKTPKREASAAASTEIADEVQIVDAMKPSTASAASQSKPLRYGTRKSRPGAKTPVVAKIGSISDTPEEEILEMDDLPIRANAPKHLIDTRTTPSESREYDEDRPRRERRPRGEHSRRDERGERSSDRNERPRRERSVRERPDREVRSAPAEATSNAEATTAPAAEAAPAKEGRPERFAMVNENERRARPSDQMLEFRPSRDGRTADASAEKRGPAKPVKKKGLFAKILSFFSGGDAAPAPKKPEGRSEASAPRRSDRPRSGNRPEGRFNDGPEGDRNRKRRPRNRNRKPRPEGEASSGGFAEGQPRNDGQPRGDGSRRRRRRPRREGEGGRGEGRREQQGTASE